MRNLVNIMKIKLIGYQVIAKHTGTRKVYFMTMTPNAKIKKKNQSSFYTWDKFLLTRQGLSVKGMVRITGPHLSMKVFI